MKSLFSLLFLSAAALGQTSVSLTWTASTTPGTSVNVYRGSSSCSNSFLKIASGVPAAGPYTAAGLFPGGTYSFQVTAVLNGQESAPSNCVLVTIPVAVPSPPASPSGLAVTPSQ
jgi:hypothetical protein